VGYHSLVLRNGVNLVTDTPSVLANNREQTARAHCDQLATYLRPTSFHAACVLSAPKLVRTFANLIF
jgi:hypothetical protein